MKPCAHSIYTAHCRICYLYETDSRYRQLWGGNPSEAKTSNIGQYQKPRLSIDEVAEKRRRCREARERGEKCTEFGNTISPTPLSQTEVQQSTVAPLPTLESKLVVRWNYGITTVPERKSILLPKTLDSLKRSGFDSPTLFVDGLSHTDSTEWEREFNLPIVNRNPPNLRTFGNWILALAELLIRDPICDFYALFQDDIVACNGIKGYINYCYRSNKLPSQGYLNLYTWGSNHDVRPRSAKGSEVYGWFEARELGESGGAMYHGRMQQTGRGAVGLVFPREAVFLLLSHRDLTERPAVPRGWRSIDGGICQTLNKCGWREYVHNPSLLQHVGKHSTIRNKPHHPSPSFPGEGFDAQSFISR